MSEMVGVSHESYPEFVLRDKSRACKQWFRDCLKTPNLDYDDWLEQKYAEFNWWISGLNADKSGPGSLDARLILRPDVRDVLVDVLDGLENALCEFHQISTSGSFLAEEHTVLAELDCQSQAPDETRPPSPWSDMSDSSKGGSSAFAPEEEDNQDADNSTSFARDKYREQRVYIQTNLEILIRIHTAIKRSGLKFRNQSADDALERAEEGFQLDKADLGEHLALQGRNGEHERFRRYLTRIILWNGYTQNLVQRISSRADTMTQTFSTQGKRYSEFLLQRKLLIVIRAYLYDPARLTTVQRRLINANVIRRNRLVYAGKATKQSFRVERAHQAQPTAQDSVQQTFLADQVQSVPVRSQSPLQSITPVTPVRSRQGESEAGRSFVAQPATALESRFSITGVLTPPRATKSSATKMSARVGHLDYPKCPAKYGQFPCPYCPIILTEDYTKKEKWRGHVAQDLCAYICVFEHCGSSEEMFSSTYEWMSHMATFHSEAEWVCYKCTKHPRSPKQDISVFFQTSALLQEHFQASHPSLDPSEYGFLIDAGKRISGIQKVRCPLCRPGLVTFERDEEDGDMTPPPSAGHEIGLIQLEEDEHIATHIHEFALHSFPSSEEDISESSKTPSHSCPSTRVEITFRGSQNLEAPNTGYSSLYSLSDITDMLDDLLGEIIILSNKLEQEHDMQRFNVIVRNLFHTSTVRLKDLEDIDAFASALNESRAYISRLRDVHVGQDTEESLLDQLLDALGRSYKVLQKVSRKITTETARYFIPFPRNPEFIGRGAILNTLKEMFFGQKHCQKTALFGIRGVGKTQIALEFSYWVKEKRPEYSILWIPTLPDEELEQWYMRIARQLGVKEPSSDKEIKDSVCRHILADKASKYLLVVDGVNSWESSFGHDQKPDIIQHFSESENCLILLTTRNKGLVADFANSIDVGQMDHEEAVCLLQCLLREKQMLQDSAVATEILSRLDYYPSSIVHTAVCLNNAGLSIQSFRDRYKDMELYDNGRGILLLLSFSLVEQSGHVVNDLLSFMSFVEPNSIPKSILPHFEKEEQESAITMLCTLALIIRKEDSVFDMPRRVQVAAQEWIEKQGRKQQAMKDAVRHITKIFDSDSTYSYPWREYLPHILRLLDYSAEHETKERYDLLLEVGKYLCRERRFEQATIFLEEVCQWREKYLPEEDHYRLESESTLGYAYLDSGRTKDAIGVFKHTAAVCQKMLPEEDDVRLFSEDGLAKAYYFNGQIKEAIEIFEHAITVYEITRPEDSLNWLSSEHWLAKAYFLIGQTKKAIELFEHVITRYQTIMPQESPDQLLSEHWLAKAYIASGRPLEAVKRLQYIVGLDISDEVRAEFQDLLTEALKESEVNPNSASSA
ncbi:hypothetical protein FHL15_010575 [Xylaria flabelliformis]|uniref:NB-ARC domain-containing protein n=1 Tax=Xylaria flabelliformis TaxID=2512241 RepID=A0A553HKQ7_9PEZI|nr:hypothetical protein FHL15_010575 [Xylaria flabelliformis]